MVLKGTDGNVSGTWMILRPYSRPSGCVIVALGWESVTASVDGAKPEVDDPTMTGKAGPVSWKTLL